MESLLRLLKYAGEDGIASATDPVPSKVKAPMRISLDTGPIDVLLPSPRSTGAARL